MEKVYENVDLYMKELNSFRDKYYIVLAFVIAFSLLAVLIILRLDSQKIAKRATPIILLIVFVVFLARYLEGTALDYNGNINKDIMRLEESFKEMDNTKEEDDKIEETLDKLETIARIKGIETVKAKEERERKERRVEEEEDITFFPFFIPIK